MNEIEELYQDIILEHYQTPRNKGTIIGPHSESVLYNPLCGDEVKVEVKKDGDVIKEVVFSGRGCALSQAAASMMTELVKGKKVEEAVQLKEKFFSMLKGSAEDEELVVLGDAQALRGVSKHTARIKCVTLAWEALEKCLERLSNKADR